jgi:hypothetical protein
MKSRTLDDLNQAATHMQNTADEFRALADQEARAALGKSLVETTAADRRAVGLSLDAELSASRVWERASQFTIPAVLHALGDETRRREDPDRRYGVPVSHETETAKDLPVAIGAVMATRLRGDMVGRRVAYVAVHKDDLGHFVLSRRTAPRITNLPADIRIVTFVYDAASGLLYFLLSSTEFSPLPVDAEIPAFVPEMVVD